MTSAALFCRHSLSAPPWSLWQPGTWEEKSRKTHGGSHAPQWKRVHSLVPDEDGVVMRVRGMWASERRGGPTR